VAVVDAIAITNATAILRAIPPDRVLNKAGKYRGKIGVELTSVDMAGNDLQNIGAITGLVALRPIRVRRIETIQNSSSVKVVVNQGVNGHHANANFKPSWIMLRTGDQDPRQGHRQNLVRYAVNVSERPDQRFLTIQGRVGWRGNGRQLLVDPAGHDIPHEQEKTVGHLVKPAISQHVGRQWAII